MSNRRRGFAQDSLGPKPQKYNRRDYSSVRNSIREQNEVIARMAKPIILGEMSTNSNSAFSPISLNIVLSFVAAGSEGATRYQFLRFLKSRSIKELNSLSSKLVTSVLADGSRLGGPRLSSVNGAWIEQSMSFKPGFKKVADDVYKAQANLADFRNKPDEERIGVNKWADKKTKGLIKDLIPPGAVDKNTRLILANALYFKGAWYKPFDTSLTKKHEFYLLNGDRIEVPFMSSRRLQCISEYDGFKTLRLGYENGRDRGRSFSMYIYLPEAKDGLGALVERMSSEPDFFERYSANEVVKVGDFRIPKFKISFGTEAKDLLIGLGLDLPFKEGGLTNMVDSGGENLKVTFIFHKCFVEVNEVGTEAAASTAAIMQISGASSPPPRYKTLDFVADHPFVFLIKEDVKGAVLFFGSVVNPSL